ncbi:MAG: hypothetical protein D6683_09830 [Actinomyces sp.]|nr:MAG: hypothetical protein D6683_09830 [Actinomyces sp.]
MLGKKATPAWLLDLHRYLGGMAVVMTGIHLLGLVADSYVYFGWKEILVPFAAQWQPGPVAWGVVAFYILVTIEVTSLMMKKMPKRAWRVIHQTSWILFGIVTIHGLQAGTDVKNPAYRWVALASIQGVFFLTVIRIMAQRKARRAASRPRPAAAAGVAG